MGMEIGDVIDIVSLFVCSVSLKSGQLFRALSRLPKGHAFRNLFYPTKDSDRIDEMRCLFVAMGLNALFIVLPHWDNMSWTHMLTHPVTLY